MQHLSQTPVLRDIEGAKKDALGILAGRTALVLNEIPSGSISFQLGTDKDSGRICIQICHYSKKSLFDIADVRAYQIEYEGDLPLSLNSFYGLKCTPIPEAEALSDLSKFTTEARRLAHTVDPDKTYEYDRRLWPVPFKSLEYDPVLWPFPLDFHYVDRKWGLNCLTAIGPDKPLGSYTDVSIAQDGGDFDTMVRQLSQRGVQYKIFPFIRPMLIYTGDPSDLMDDSKEPQDEKYKWVEARERWIYAWDQQVLQSLLERNAQILIQHKWPTDCEEFVKRVFEKQAPVESPVFRVIAEAFNGLDMLGLYESEKRKREQSWG